MRERKSGYAGWLFGLARQIARLFRSRRRASESSPEPTPTATPPSETPEPEPRTLGPYRLGRVLGKGAMGMVHEGRDSRNNRRVAIKTMALSQTFDADELIEVKERFFREAESAGRLAHPCIVAVHDSGEEDGTAYIAMEYLEGSSLVPFTRPDHLLPLPRVLDLVARVADALDYAHRGNVVHRDVKPANILYDPVSDEVRITDFGVARLTDSSKTKTGMVLGTPSHMSPEQLTGIRIDGRSDIYSLGVTLYQLLCGQLPFVSTSMAQLMFKITRESAPDIRAINPQVPDNVVAVIDRAMQKERANRYPNGSAMAEDLRACLRQAARRPMNADGQR